MVTTMNYGPSDLGKFRKTNLGQKVRRVVEDRDNILRMTTLSEHGMPAVQAIGKRLQALGPDVKEDSVKRTIGRWVKEVLASEGWVPERSGRVASGNLFATGAIYVEKRDN